MASFLLFSSVAEAEARVPILKLFTVRLPAPHGRICLVRRANNTWAAFDDACPHKLATFSQGGHLNPAEEIICPLHSYAFELVTGAETTGQSCGPLRLHTIYIDAGGLTLTIAPKP